MPTLPLITDFTSPTLTEGQFKEAMTALISFLQSVLGTDGDPTASMAQMGVPFSKVLFNTSTNRTCTLADRGALVIGNGTGELVELPAASSFPAGYHIAARKSGSGTLVIADNPVGTPWQTIYPGEAAMFVSDGTTWRYIPISGYTKDKILGTVAQSAGVPTGAVIQRGGNANGEYVRFADGTQICTSTGLSATNTSTALGSIFRSDNVTWTYPIAFAAAPVVTGSVDNANSWLTTSPPNATSCILRALAGVTNASAVDIRAMAVGRWF